MKVLNNLKLKVGPWELMGAAALLSFKAQELGCTDEFGDINFVVVRKVDSDAFIPGFFTGDYDKIIEHPDCQVETNHVKVVLTVSVPMEHGSLIIKAEVKSYFDDEIINLLKSLGNIKEHYSSYQTISCGGY